MKHSKESSPQPATSTKSAQKQQWQAVTYETHCKDIKPRGISKKARELQMKVSTFSRLKKRGDKGINFLSQKGQGKPKEFDDKDIKRISPYLIIGKLCILKSTMRQILARKRNISLDELPKNLVSSKYLCFLKQRWYEIFQTDKKTLKAQLKNSSFSSHPLNIIQQHQFIDSSSCSSDHSSGIQSGEDSQQFSSADFFEASQSSQSDGSGSQVQSVLIEGLTSHLQNLEISEQSFSPNVSQTVSEDSCSLVFSQGNSGDLNRYNSNTNNDCQSSYQIESDIQVQSDSIEGLSSHLDNIEISENSCYPQFSQGHLEDSGSLFLSQGNFGDFNSCNSNNANNDCSSSPQIQSDQQWTPYPFKGYDSPLFNEENTSGFPWSADLNFESKDQINDFNHNCLLQSCNSITLDHQQSFPFPNQHLVSPLHNMESSSDLQRYASSDMSTQATASSETSYQLMEFNLSQDIENNRLDNEDQSDSEFLQVP